MLEKTINKLGIYLRLVELTDAEFILSLRTNPDLSRFLSYTPNDIEKQRNWIAQYKTKEEKNEEFYYIAGISDKKLLGTSRIYNIDKESFEIGSWLFSADTPDGIAIKTDIICRQMAFEGLNASFCRFEVRKMNKTVVRYHLGYNPILKGEDELNFYYELSKENFYQHANKLLKFI